ncbi:MAG: class I SAM-dependent methyltransferase [Candidatus Hydrogenedens sp.]
MNRQEWYISAFEEWYPIIYQHRDAKEARKQVTFAYSELNLHYNSKTLDLCCGYGRHLVFLSEKISFVVGYDLSLYLLKTAQRLLPNKISLVRGDVRYLPFSPKSFDAVLNFFTSFGYFEEDRENVRQIEQVSFVLKNKGKFLFDYLNSIQVQKIKNVITEKTYKTYIIKENRCYDESKKELRKDVSIYLNNQLKKFYTERVRVYSLEEILKMFSSQNLCIQKIYGNYNKEPYTEESPRLIIVGEKNE